MCLCCVCCVSGKVCTYITAFLTGIEAFCFACLNLVLILGYTCKIEPPQKDHLAAGFEYIEQCWSWFFYDEEKCIKNQGPFYLPPPWIIDIPSYFNESSVENAVSPHANYCYQIIYFILHALWFFSIFLLAYGNGKRRWRYFLPWIVVTIAITFLDTLVGAFYIKLMDDTDPGWEDGRAIFSMQFLYFRTFFLYGLNIILIVFIISTAISIHRKQKRLEKLVKKMHKEEREVVVKQTVVTSAQKGASGSTYPYPGYVPPISTGTEVTTKADARQYPDEEHSSSPGDSIEPIRNPAPARIRPFSYMNPNYRPSDQYDLEGMRSHSPALPGQSDASPSGRYEEPVGYIDRIPKARLKQ